jgi:hypothetical protein
VNWFTRRGEQTTVRDVESRHSASDASGSAHRAESSGSRSNPATISPALNVR